MNNQNSSDNKKLWTIAKRAYPPAGGYNGYDRPTGSSSSGSDASDHETPAPTVPVVLNISQEELKKVWGE